MRDFSTSVSIAAPVDTVWRVLADVEQWSEWTPTVRRIKRLDTGPLDVGARVRIQQPRLRPAVWTVTSWQPAKGFTWVARRPGLIVSAEHALDAATDGTRVTLAVRYGGLLGPLAGNVAGGLTKKYLGVEASGLKNRCERRS